MQEVLIVLIITGLACGLLGPFIVLRNLSMTADALSHSVLLGIVISFAIVKDLSSPFLIVGAGIFGVLTVLFVETLSKNKLVKEDDALGIVFPLFLSIAIIIITKYFRNAHIDTDIVLMGNPLFAPFVRMFNLPKSFVVMSILFFVNLIFVVVFYNKLKISTFDEAYAKLRNIKTGYIFYALMILTSFTCVSAFDSVGAILVISFFVTPSATAYLITKDLKYTILFTLIISTINCIIGFYIAVYLNVSISGMCSFVSMITCGLVIIFNPKGIIYKKINNYKNRSKLSKDLILIHIFKHSYDKEELGLKTIHNHLNWSKNKSENYLSNLLDDGMIVVNSVSDIYELSEKGNNYVKILLGR